MKKLSGKLSLVTSEVIFGHERSHFWSREVIFV